jgi:hypothetical protein
MSFLTGVVVSHGVRRVIVMRPKRIAEYYIVHSSAITDFIATFSLWMLVGSPVGMQ